MMIKSSILTALFLSLISLTAHANPKDAAAAAAAKEITLEGIKQFNKIRGTAFSTVTHAVLPGLQGAGDSNVRHIYNVSNVPWFITGSAGSGFCEQTCVIPVIPERARNDTLKNAGNKYRVPYITGTTTHIKIESEYYSNLYAVKNGNYIVHSGNTREAKLNWPAAGDILLHVPGQDRGWVN